MVPSDVLDLLSVNLASLRTLSPIPLIRRRNFQSNSDSKEISMSVRRELKLRLQELSGCFAAFSSRAIQIGMNLSVLEEWVGSMGLPRGVQSHFLPVRDLLNWLQVSIC